MQNFILVIFSHLSIIYLKKSSHLNIQDSLQTAFFSLIEQPYCFCVVISV